MRLLKRGRSKALETSKSKAKLHDPLEDSGKTFVTDGSFGSLDNSICSDDSRSLNLLSASIRSTQTSQNDGFLYLQRDQIEIGDLLGTGSFARVYHVSELFSGGKTGKSASKNTSSRRRSKKGNKSLQDFTEGTSRGTSSESTPRYAIKLLDRRRMKRSAMLRAAANDLKIEAAHLKQCKGHPFIIQLVGLPTIDIEEWDHVSRVDKLFLVMNKLDETLDQRIMRWRKEQEQSDLNKHLERSPHFAKVKLGQLMEKTAYALQICSALKYLHEKRLIYRDLKPQNIGFISKEKNPKNYLDELLEEQEDECDGLVMMKDKVQLFDFGLCRELPSHQSADADDMAKACFYHKTHLGDSNCCDNSGHTGMYHLPETSGSPMYMAGETVMTGGYCNLKSDVYSWALVYYEMLSLEAAFGGYTREELQEMVWIRGCRPSLSKSDRLNGVPKSLVSLLKMSWSKYPSKRPTSGECCTKLEAILMELRLKQM